MRVILDSWIVEPALIFRFRCWAKHSILLRLCQDVVHCAKTGLTPPDSLRQLDLFLFELSAPIWANISQSALALWLLTNLVRSVFIGACYRGNCLLLLLLLLSFRSLFLGKSSEFGLISLILDLVLNCGLLEANVDAFDLTLHL